MANVRIAVIGLGPAGVTVIKALREEGFDVVGFERRDAVGGIWSYSTNLGYTSVIDDTVANVSKFVSAFSDFPVPKDSPPYMTGAQVAGYLDAYARNFDLHRHVRFKTTVRRVLRDKLDRGWDVHVSGPDGDAVLNFDKVVVGSGSDSVPSWPPIPGRQLFHGTIIHGQGYRKPEQFAGKRVLVVGIGNTACEVALSLTTQASKVYQSYRSGRIVLPRYFDDGVPTDSKTPWPRLWLQYRLEAKFPWLMYHLGDRAARKTMLDTAARSNTQEQDPKEPGNSTRTRRKLAAQKIKGDWRLLPSASMAHIHPVVQDRFLAALESGHIAPARGFKAFTGADEVLLDDCSSIRVDAVIFCTGYKLDFDMMPELDMNGACGLPLETAAETRAGSGVSKEPHLPRLYHMVFPPRWASSVAFLSWMSPLETYWCVCELSSMAVAQVWAAETAKEQGTQRPANGYRRPALLPSEEEMNAEVDQYHAWWRRQWRKEPSMHHGMLRSNSFFRFLHGMAGTGMFENMDHPFTLQNWRLKRRDKELHTLFSQGPPHSSSWRIFDTNPLGIPGCGRKALPGARQELREVNNEYHKYKQDMEDEELRAQVMINC